MSANQHIPAPYNRGAIQPTPSPKDTAAVTGRAELGYHRMPNRSP
jgi:hypothetical protein